MGFGGRQEGGDHEKMSKPAEHAPTIARPGRPVKPRRQFGNSHFEYQPDKTADKLTFAREGGRRLECCASWPKLAMRSE
jgi:hypothetical protein